MTDSLQPPGDDRQGGTASNLRRRKRQRQERRHMTAPRSKPTPWPILLQSLGVVLLVAASTVSFGWQQPVHLVVAATATAIITGVTAFQIDKHTKRNSVMKYMLLPVATIGSLVLTAGFVLSLDRLPGGSGGSAQEFRSAEAQKQPGTDLYESDPAAILLQEVFDDTGDPVWEEQRAELEGQDRLTRSATESAEGTPEETQAGSSREANGSELSAVDSDDQSLMSGGDSGEAEQGATLPNANRTSNAMRNTPGVVQRVLQLQESHKFSVADLYLRDLIQTQPRSEWQCDYEQLYIDHWVDWGNAQADLDQRHLCYLKALKSARKFRRDTSVLRRLLVSLEAELATLPRLLPAGCRLVIHRAESDGAELVVELSVLTPQGTFLHGLKRSDFQIKSGPVFVESFKLAGSDRLRAPAERSVAVIVDLACNDDLTAESRLAAAGEFLESLPAETSRTVLQLADDVCAYSWDSQAVESLPSDCEPTRTEFLPPLRKAIDVALQQLSGRDGLKDLIVFSQGRESQQPYFTSTSLIKQASQEEIRIHAIVNEAATQSVRGLLEDLSRTSGGSMKTIAAGEQFTAWDKSRELFHEGNIVLRIPLVELAGGDLRIVVGRGATLQYAILDAPSLQ